MIDIWNEKALLIIGPISVQRTFLNTLCKAKWDEADSKLSVRRWTNSMANRECESFTDLIKAGGDLICFNLPRREYDIQITFNYVAEFQEFQHNKIWKLVFWMDIEDGTLDKIGATGLSFTKRFDLLVLTNRFYI